MSLVTNFMTGVLLVFAAEGAGAWIEPLLPNWVGARGLTATALGLVLVLGLLWAIARL